MRSGQALVMVLLVLGIAITIGLSVVSRSVTDVSVSTTQDESSKALEAAEAGVERALSGVLSPVSTPVPGVVGTSTDQYQVEIKPLTVDASSIFEIPPVVAGDVVSLDLVGYTGNRMCVYWGSPGVSPTGIETIDYYGNVGSMAVAREAVSPEGRGGFASPSSGSCPSSPRFTNRHSVLIQPLTRLLRVRLVFNSTPVPIGFSPLGGTLPVQGNDILSTGQSGGTTQRLRVVQTDADTSMMFDTALFSGTDLVQ